MDSMGRIENKFLDLKLKFIKKLPDRFNDIQKDWDDLDPRSWSQEKAVGIHRKVHSLVGISGIHGLDYLSVSAKKLEDKIEMATQKGVRPTDEWRIAVQSLLIELGEAIQQDSNQQGSNQQGSNQQGSNQNSIEGSQ